MSNTMPSDLKPTTREERERWKASAEYRTGPNDEIILRLIADHARLNAALEPFASIGRIFPKDRADITDIEQLVDIPTKVKYYLVAREALDAQD